MFSLAQAKSQGRQSYDDLRRGAGGLADQAMAYGHTAAEIARDKAGRARETAEEYLREGRRQAAFYESELESLIKTYPVEAVLIAAGVGFLAGWCVFRRRNSTHNK